jgi:Uma2 family endonuclease
MQLVQTDIIYPCSDGQPMADSTLQYQWITQIKEGCELLFKDDPNVFIAGDLLWYPVEGQTTIGQAPDVMVVFGRPKGHRLSYLQWREGNVIPQVVFEIRSHHDSQTKMNRKQAFYNRYGVDGLLEVIEPMPGWVSPRLGIRLELGEEGLELYRPDGERFLSYLELEERRELAEQRAEQATQQAQQERERAEQATQQAQQERERAEQAAQQAQQERERAEQAAQQAQQERERAERLAAKLRELNIDPDSF